MVADSRSVQPTDAALADFCYTMFVDHDGKFHLGMLSTSGFKPLP